MNIELLVAIIGLLCSAFFSGAEMAFIASNPMQIEVWKRQKVRGAEKSSQLLKSPLTMLHLTLAGTAISNILTISFTVLVLTNIQPTIPGILLVVFVLFIFGDVLPKTIFRERANRLIVRITPLIRFFSFLFYPLVKLTTLFGKILSKWVHTVDEPQDLLKNELRLLFSDTGPNDVIEPHEKRFITKLFSFGQQTAREVMTPRMEISAVEVSKSLDEAIDIFLESGHSKLPIYKETIDQIIGFVFLHDLFDSHGSLQEVAREATFVPESKNIGDVLREFQENNNSIGIVIDEYGGTAGVVTIEDIVEELFGEFEDEFDFDEVILKKTENGYIVSARAEVDYINESIQLGIPGGDYETLGGFLEDRLGRIPATGEEFSFGSLQFIITKSSQKKIEQVKILHTGNSELLSPHSGPI